MKLMTPRKLYNNNNNNNNNNPDPVYGIGETFSYRDIDFGVDTGASDWQGVAQAFDISLYINSTMNLGKDCLIGLYLYNTSRPGLKYRIGLYESIDHSSCSCIAISNLLTTTGNNFGNCVVKLTQYKKETPIIIDPQKEYDIAFCIAQRNTGNIQLGGRREITPFESQHITYPSGFNAESPDDQWATLKHEGWDSKYDIWFCLAPTSTGTERLP